MRVDCWKDRKHWEISVLGYVVYRWCEGAPCHLVPGAHPVRAYRDLPRAAGQPEGDLDA